MAGVVMGTSEMPIFFFFFIYILCVYTVHILACHNYIIVITVLSWKINTDIHYYRVRFIYFSLLMKDVAHYDAPRGGECREALPNWAVFVVRVPIIGLVD